MTTPYVDPNTIHNPATGTSPPATWGDTVRDDLQFLANVPGVRVERTAAQSVADTTATIITFDTGNATEHRDTDSYHSLSSNPTRLTVPAGLGGTYLFHGWVRFGGATSTFRQIRYRINGATIQVMAGTQASGLDDCFMSFSVSIALTAGDYVELQVYHRNGSNVNVYGNVELVLLYLA